jgi:MYXO-CTERM domain-containing protein
MHPILLRLLVLPFATERHMLRASCCACAAVRHQHQHSAALLLLLLLLLLVRSV